MSSSPDGSDGPRCRRPRSTVNMPAGLGRAAGRRRAVDAAAPDATDVRSPAPRRRAGRRRLGPVTLTLSNVAVLGVDVGPAVLLLARPTCWLARARRGDEQPDLGGRPAAPASVDGADLAPGRRRRPTRTPVTVVPARVSRSQRGAGRRCRPTSVAKSACSRTPWPRRDHERRVRRAPGSVLALIMTPALAPVAAVLLGQHPGDDAAVAGRAAGARSGTRRRWSGPPLVSALVLLPAATSMRQQDGQRDRDDQRHHAVRAPTAASSTRPAAAGRSRPGHRAVIAPLPTVGG